MNFSMGMFFLWQANLPVVNDNHQKLQATVLLWECSCINDTIEQCQTHFQLDRKRHRNKEGKKSCFRVFLMGILFPKEQFWLLLCCFLKENYKYQLACLPTLSVWGLCFASLHVSVVNMLILFNLGVMSLVFTVPAFTSVGDSGAICLVLSARLEAISTVLIITKGENGQSSKGLAQKHGMYFITPQSVASLWSDEIFNKNILYFWAASQWQSLKPCFKDHNTHRCFAQMPSIQQNLVSGWEIDDTHICLAFTRDFTTHWNLLTAETAFLTCISSIAIYNSAIHKAPLFLGSPSQICEIMGTGLFKIIHHLLHTSLLIYSGINQVKIILEYWKCRFI